MRSLNDIKEKLATGDCKVLVIQTAFLGDVILTTPLLRALRSNYRNVFVTALVLPQFAPIVAPFVDKVIPFDKRDRDNLSQNWLDLIKRLKQERFDLALIPHRSARSGATASKAGIPVRIGFKRGAGSYFHTHKVDYPPNLYEGERNLELLRVLDDISDNGLPELHFNDKDIDRVSQLLVEHDLIDRSFVVFAPGSVWFTKRWLPEYYIELSELIQKEFNFPVVTIGGKEDVSLGESVVAEKQYNLAGKLSLLESTALIQRAKLLVSGDSAPAHMATSVDTRQAIIFGSTTPRFGFAPDTRNVKLFGVDLWCRPCTGHGRKQCPKGTFNCMREIKPVDVLEAIREWLLK